MDWDWLLPFPVLSAGGSGERAQWYYGTDNYDRKPASTLLAAAGRLLETQSYHYSVCETGFLRAFADADPAGFAKLVAAGTANGNLRIAGGGITSADNLLPHGEAFIRNYLVGQVWLAARCPGLPLTTTLWIPDDFGQDSQLPVVAQALGLTAAGFWRIPGAQSYWNGPAMPRPLDGTSPPLAEQLQAPMGKLDFVWSAADGSSILAHWLAVEYGTANTVGTAAALQALLPALYPSSPTPYVYMPVLSDFSMPNPSLPALVAEWNGSGEYDGNALSAVNASFDDFARLVAFHAHSLDTKPVSPFPYWTGFLASRPALKVLHQRATRTLLAAETFSLIAGWTQPGGGTAAAGTGNPQAALLLEAWELLVPSTHHDYITGTAIPDVYHTEQRRLLEQADARAAWLLRDAMDTIAGAITAELAELPVAVFNPLGFARSGVVELSAAQVARLGGSVSGAGFQPTPTGGVLFTASAPSLGYQTAYLQAAPAPADPASVSPAVPGPGPVTLTNGLVSATLTPGVQGVWGLTSVVDHGRGGGEVVRQGAVANDLLFYYDGGTEYQFGMELPPPPWEPQPPPWSLSDVSAHLSDPALQVIEGGPLRVTVRTSVTYDDGTSRIEYVRDYVLHAGEPMLRMRSTGAAPLLSTAGVQNRGCSVVVAFPLASPGIEAIAHGTPCHWTNTAPDIYWNGQTFLPTHAFVIPLHDGVPCCAVYHADVAPWGLKHAWNGKAFEPSDGVLYGCLWRNGDGNYFGWTYQQSPPAPAPGLGTDPEVLVREYALRMPSSLQGPESGMPLREALAFASPLRGVPVSPWTGQLPATASLVSSSDDRALVTVAKAGTVRPDDVVLRVYQPTNLPLKTVTLTLDPRLAGSGTGAMAVRAQTALEQDLPAAEQAAFGLESTASTLTLALPRALATLAVTPAGAVPPSPAAA